MNDVTRTLTKHFFRRFFDNDTVHTDGDMQTTVVRTICILSAPGLLIAFFVAALAGHRLPLWVGILYRYLFTLYSFVVMGAVAIFEWHMLFPDRLDFLVLTPLSIEPKKMLVAKVKALAMFLAIVLVGMNAFSTLLVPITFHGGYVRPLLAHAVAVTMAGVFAAMCVLLVGSVMLCVLDAQRFRSVSPVVQASMMLVLMLLFLQFVHYGESIPVMLTGPGLVARWFPPLWFQGLYEELLQGADAPAFAGLMTRYALLGTAAVGTLVALLYPMAWARMRTIAMEGAIPKQKRKGQWMDAMLHRLVKRPGERAVFHFIGQTLRRESRYQVYLAMYCGAGLALAVSSVVVLRNAGGSVHAGVSSEGMDVVVPLLVFWGVTGLRNAFGFPVNLQAGWMFRVTGVRMSESASATRMWVRLYAVVVMGVAAVALLAAGCSLERLMVQCVCGATLGLLLSEGFFFYQPSVPFNRPRMPGRTNFPMLLTMYFGVFPLLMIYVVKLETQLAAHPLRLLWVVLLAVAARLMFVALRKLLGEAEEVAEGYDGEFVLLGLS